MDFYGREPLLSLADQLVSTSGGDLVPDGGHRPILIVTGCSGSGRTSFLEELALRWSEHVPTARLMFPMAYPARDGEIARDAVRSLLPEILLWLGRRMPGYRLAFRRCTLALIAMAGPQLPADAALAHREMQNRLTSYQGARLSAFLRTFLVPAAKAVAAAGAHGAPPLQPLAESTAATLVTSVLRQLRPAAPARPPLQFDAGDGGSAPSQDNAAQAVCGYGQPAPATVFYAARAVQLSSFLRDIIRLRATGFCNRTVNVLSFSDAAQLRVSALGLESVREEVLASRAFREPGSWLHIVYTPLADPDLITRSSPPPAGYGDLRAAMQHLGIPLADLDDGWAIESYDAFAAVAAALQQPGGIQAALVNQASAPFPIEGADGPVTFGPDGNRVGLPTVVQLCPAGSGDQVTTVPVQAGHQPGC